MTGTRVPLSVLDLVPVASGASAAHAVHNSIDLARRAETLGYGRYWFAEHHLSQGVAGTAPTVMIGLAAAATRTIRVGSAGVQLGHRTPLSVVEEFGLLDCAYPGRLDLGLGRTRGTPRRRPEGATGGDPLASPSPQHPEGDRTIDGVVIPAPPSLERLRRSPRMALARSLLQQPDAITPGYDQQIGDVLALLRGEYRSPLGLEAHVTPGEGAGVEVWILGSGGGESAEVAGHNSLRFAANYHVNPAGVLDAVGAYRAAFRPGASSRTRISACQSMSSSPKTPPGPGSSPPATACGSSASARGKELSPSRPTTRHAPTSGPTRSGGWSPTASRPRSSDPPRRWWSSSSGSSG